MRNRGARFWEWADRELHSRTHEERLSDGVLIDVQSRLSREGVTQLFIGVYKRDGAMLLEEYYTDRQGQTISHALAWGTDRARLVASSSELNLSDGFAPIRPQPLAVR